MVIILKLFIPLFFKIFNSFLSYKYIKKNIADNKKTNGSNSKKTVGIFNNVKTIGITIDTLIYSKNLISSKIFKKKLRHKKTTLTIIKLFKKTLTI